MQRVTITLDDELMRALDQLILARGYQNRSEAIRDLARAGIQQAVLEAESAPDCIAALVYVYEYDARALASRLAGLFHENHDLSVTTTHMHLNHQSGLEVALLRGPTAKVRQLADAVLTERGVRYGQAVIVPALVDAEEHHHEGPQAQSHTHIHAR